MALVAPYVGAWIETSTNLNIYELEQSHPMWVRGLKLITLDDRYVMLHVAPYVGAWIETLFLFGNFKIGLSHPMWVRGLKLI